MRLQANKWLKATAFSHSAFLRFSNYSFRVGNLVQGSFAMKNFLIIKIV